MIFKRRKAKPRGRWRSSIWTKTLVQVTIANKLLSKQPLHKGRWCREQLKSSAWTDLCWAWLDRLLLYRLYWDGSLRERRNSKDPRYRCSNSSCIAVNYHDIICVLIINCVSINLLLIVFSEVNVPEPKLRKENPSNTIGKRRKKGLVWIVVKSHHKLDRYHLDHLRKSKTLYLLDHFPCMIEQNVLLRFKTL